jgi:topoisomerase-4 subunit A
VAIGEKDQQYLLASDAGYGFVATIGDMQTKNKAGKVILSLPKGALVMQPVLVNNYASDWIAAISNEGRLLMFPVAELPVMAKGKGVKIMNIPPARVADRIEMMAAVVILTEQDSLVIHSGKRFIALKFNDLKVYQGERARRGRKLPRGFQRVDRVDARTE